jgi:predicted transcriptional regulator of viral defense system
MRNQLLNSIIRNGEIFTLDDARRNSNISSESLYVLLHRMEKKGMIERIEKGKYYIVPMGEEKGEISYHEFLIGKFLLQPSVVSYWSALNYHGLTEQIPNTVFLQSIKRKKNPHPEIFGIRFHFINIDERSMFGTTTIWIEGERVKITNREKTIVDCLHRPDLCGGIIEVAKGLRERTFDGKKLSEYASKMGNSGIIRRLGYISDLLDLDIPVEPVKTRNYLSLDPTLPGSIRRSSKWRLKINMEEGDILGD